jgi:signal transduction histidine kinase
MKIAWLISLGMCWITLLANPTFADSSMVNLQQEKDPVKQVILLRKMAAEASDPEMSSIYLQKALNHSLKLKNDTLLAKNWQLLADQLAVMGKFIEADSVIELAFQRLGSSDNDQLLVSILNTRGDIRYNLGNIEEATVDFLEALKTFDQMGSNNGCFACYNNLGRVFWKIGNLDKAAGYFKKLLNLAIEKNETRHQAAAMGNLGLLYRKQNDLDSALYYYLASQELYESLQDTFNLAINLQNLGIVYQQMQDYDQAFESFTRSNNYSKLVKDEMGIVLTAYNLATLSFETKQQEQGLQFFKKAEEIALKNKYQGVLLDLYYHMAMASHEMDQNEQAFNYLNQHLALKDSILGEEHLKQIEELEIRYNTAKKEKELLTSNLMLVEKEGQLRTILSTGAGLMVSLVLLFLVFNYRRESRLRKTSILAVAEAQEIERQRIARDLHDSVGSMLATLRSEMMMKLHNHEDIRLFDQVNDELRRISHAMMPATLQKFGLAAAIRSELELVKLQSKLDVEFNEFGLEEKQLSRDKQLHIYRVVQEAIQNILKHASASRIMISLTGSGQNLNLMIEDDGTGFHPDKPSPGLGMKNMMIRVEQILNGNFRIDSRLSMGTIINVNIPLARS